MKKLLTTTLLLFAILQATASIDSLSASSTDTLSVKATRKADKQTETIDFVKKAQSNKLAKQSIAKKTKNKSGRFLPTTKRIDREIDRLKFAYKGEVMMGVTASYGTLSSDDTDFMVILDNINLSGTIASVKPFIGYFYHDNSCIGMRFGYEHMSASIGNIDLDLGEQNDLSFSLSNYDFTSDKYSFAVFHRKYVGLDPKGRFGLFSDLALSLSSGSSTFKSKANEDSAWKVTKSDNFQVKLSFNPGVAVYIFPNVCGTLSFGLGGIQYNKVNQKDENGNSVGSREASKMRFRLNLADINIGVVIHMWDKKKR